MLGIGRATRPMPSIRFFRGFQRNPRRPIRVEGSIGNQRERHSMKRRLLITVAALAAATLACNIGVNVPRVNTGPTQTLTISQPAASDIQHTDGQGTMGAGAPKIGPGSEGRWGGPVRDNVAGW